MAREGNTRSRSPHNSKEETPTLSFDFLWEQVGLQLNAFEDKIKNVVRALVNQEVARIEKKTDGNQDVNNDRFASMESKFDKLESNLDKKFSALQATIAGNPPPPQLEQVPMWLLAVVMVLVFLMQQWQRLQHF